MEKPKVGMSTKSKQSQQQANILNNVLAQFQIQTQVKKMVLKQFSLLMLSNKQAFQFIKQSQQKFISFQERLSKSQTYYLNIQSNINSKIQLTQNMNLRLQQFATQFWNGMKQNNNQLIGMGKKYQQLNHDRRTMDIRQSQMDKAIKRTQNNINHLTQKITDQVDKLLHRIRDQQDKVNKQFTNRKKQLLDLNTTLLQSQALLQSKSSILTQLLTDLRLYKQDRPGIHSQIQKIFQQIQQRAFKTEINDLRGYVDSQLMNEQTRINLVTSKLKNIIQAEQQQRKSQSSKLSQRIKINKQMIEKNDKQANEKMLKVQNQLQTNINELSISTSLQIQNTNKILSDLISEYRKQKPQIALLIATNKTNIQNLTSKLKLCSEEILQATSNISSINQTISLIVKENDKRRDDMNSLKSSSQNQGNVTQQLMNLLQNFQILTKKHENLQRQTFEQIKKVKESSIQSNEQFDRCLEKLKVSTQESIKNLSSKLSSQQSSSSSLLNSLQNTLKISINRVQNQSRLFIEQRLSSISTQLDQLDKIHQQIKLFKGQFKTQIQQNQKVNASVADKMERVMGLFTKLKSDNAVRFQQLTEDLQRRAVQLKSSLAQLDDIKKYLSVSNQCINLLLAFYICQQPIGKTLHAKDQFSSFNSIAVTTDNKDDLTTQVLAKVIKISSILQGWILQTEQNGDKNKYRGQKFNLVNRIKLAQTAFDYFVKQSDKIKGKILENGKDIFNKILQSSQDVFKQRKRAVSRRRPSELPKLQF